MLKSLLSQYLRLGIFSVLILALMGQIEITQTYPLTVSYVDYRTKNPELRGVWVQTKSITSPEKVEEVLRRVESGHFNAIFVNVFRAGEVVYDSRFAEKYDRIEPGFDPLALLVPEAHRRNIQVHAWFPAGRVGYQDTAPILIEHPDWGLVGPDGKKTAWLNFTRPDVRQYISDLMLETVERYGVDGLHFDYTRYPSSEWGFDPYSIEAFTNLYNFDLNQLRYADLPAYGLFEGNPLINPKSAQVLATFANGVPAVTLNRYGEGEVVLINWDAGKRNVAVGSEIIQRSLRRMLDNGGQVFVLLSELTTKEYGQGNFETGMTWLQQLGWKPIEIHEDELTYLTSASVLVLPNVYLISPETGASLADFVQRGGGIIFIDGPTRSIDQKNIKAITGMNSRGRHFNESNLMISKGNHPLIPTSMRSANLKASETWDARWREFRQQGINLLIKNIYTRVKEKYPDIGITVTITSDKEKASQRYLQDWPDWLDGKYIDLLIPRGYVEEARDLNGVLVAWRPELKAHDPIAIGLKAYFSSDQAEDPKPPDQLLAEIKMVRKAGSAGIIIFDLEHMSDEQLKALANGPFSQSATP